MMIQKESSSDFWQRYYAKTYDRSPRPFYKFALKFADEAMNGAGSRMAIDGSASKMALDIGCGSGIETLDLLQMGWNVLAVDKEPIAIETTKVRVGNGFAAGLSTQVSTLEDLVALPKVDFAWAFHTLQLCKPEQFDRVWRLLIDAVSQGGIFAGTFFGLNDSWVNDSKALGFSERELAELFKDFKVLHSKELDQVGPTPLQGPKRWHYTQIVALKL